MAYYSAATLSGMGQASRDTEIYNPDTGQWEKIGRPGVALQLPAKDTTFQQALAIELARQRAPSKKLPSWALWAFAGVVVVGVFAAFSMERNRKA